VTDLGWLDRFVSHDSGHPLWDAVHRAHGLAFASDGRSLLAVDDPAATFDGPAFAGVGAIFRGDDAAGRHERLSRLLVEETPADAAPADLLDLWAWLDRVERVQCDSCRRIRAFYELGDSDPVGVCPECDGRGWFYTMFEPDDPKTVVTILGLPFDRNRLAWWLPGELWDVCGGRTACRVFPSGAAAMQSVTFVGRGWRLVCASLKRESNPRQYREYRLGCGAWWSHRHDAKAVAAAEDWAQERGMSPGSLWGASP